MTTRSPRILAISAVAALLLAPAAHAQNDFEQGELESFVQARADVRDIQQEYASRLQSTQDDQKVAELQSEAQQKMATAVEDAGLSVQEFNQIAQAAQNDPELSEEIQDLAE